MYTSDFITYYCVQCMYMYAGTDVYLVNLLCFVFYCTFIKTYTFVNMRQQLDVI